MKIARKILSVMLFYSIALILCGVLVGDLKNSISGLASILSSPAQLTLDYFKIGTVSGTFLNSGLVGLVSVGLLKISHTKLNGTSLMAYFLTVGFSFFGINVINIWPCFLGVWLYAKASKTPFSQHANMALFATSLCPFVSEMICRYPIAADFTVCVLLAILVGAAAGFLLPAMAKNGHLLHRGYSLYNAASVAGFIGMLLFLILFPLMGVDKPDNTRIGSSYLAVVNGFYIAMCVLMILTGFFLNGKSFKGFGRLLFSTGYEADFVSEFGLGLTLINIGIFGLFTAAYYLVIGAPFTGPTAGCMLCLLAIAPCGANLLNVLPIMAGYVLAHITGAADINAQRIVVGFCFAGALCPVSGRFGSIAGVIAGFLHAMVVTTTVTFHGGFCLYNGGFAAGITAMAFVPLLEALFTPQEHLRILPVGKGKEK